eukprot:11086030-Ditylum_brightwellii.AAC.1
MPVLWIEGRADEILSKKENYGKLQGNGNIGEAWRKARFVVGGKGSKYGNQDGNYGGKRGQQWSRGQ